MFDQLLNVLLYAGAWLLGAIVVWFVMSYIIGCRLAKYDKGSYRYYSYAADWAIARFFISTCWPGAVPAVIAVLGIIATSYMLWTHIITPLFNITKIGGLTKKIEMLGAKHGCWPKKKS